MEQKELDQLIEAREKYQELLGAAYSEISFAANDLKSKMQDAFFALYPDAKVKNMCLKYAPSVRWMFTTDFLEIDDSDDPIYIQFWEYGYGGDRDECLKSIQVDMNLLTEEGRKKTVEDWTKNELEKSIKSKMNKEEETLRKIKQLEDELKQLKGETV